VVTSNTGLEEEVRVESRVELLGVRYAEAWFDTKAGEWQTVGYIDREEALGLYDQRIQAGMVRVRHLAAQAKGTEPLYGCAFLHQAAGFSKAIETDVLMAEVIAGRARSASVREELRGIGDAYQALRASVTLRMNAAAQGTEDDRAFAERIGRRVQEVLEEAGFTFAAGGAKARYTVTVGTTQAREEYEAGLFIRAALEIRIEGAGKPLFSYTKNYDRMGHRTLSGAYNRAALHIEKDLEAHLVGALLDSVIRTEE
jgi:hypothetical protein